MTIDEKLNHLSDYMGYVVDIICNKPHYWLGEFHKNKLPNFDYYIKNCVLDKGGVYDFTVRRYRTHSEVIMPIAHHDKPQMKFAQKKVYSTVNFSRWHFTAFNYKQEIEL